MVAYDLRVEGRTTPLGIDTPHPRVAWRRSGDGDPVAYRVTVAPDGATSSWSTGWVESTDCFGVVLETALRPSTRYTWSVEQRLADGSTSEPVESWFETGLLTPGAADAEWIGWNRFGAPEAFDPPTDDDHSSAVRHLDPVAHLRRDFDTPAPVESARIYITARGTYRAFLNGTRIGNDELTPGWTDYNDRVLYQTYDVTDLVAEGSNALSVLLADGWYAGYIGFDARRQGNHYGTAPQLWAVLDLIHTDGSTTRVTSDADWRQASGALRYSDQLMGEYQDLRLELGDWTASDFDVSPWQPVRILDTDTSTISAALDEPIRVVKELPVANSFITPQDEAIYDFGQNLVGRVRVDLGVLPEGAKVVFRYGEMLEDGRLYTANLRTAEATDVVIGSGEPVVFEPIFTIHGFRYLEITGAAPAADSVTAVVLHNDLRFTGSLRTSSADVNQLISNIEWGLRGNYVGVPTDCPQRDERLGWLADAQVFLPTAAYMADVEAFFTRWLGDIRYAQSKEGSFADVAPVVTNFFGDGSPAWADAGVIMPWHLYRVYGDRRVLEDSFDSMARYADFLVEHNPDFLWTRRVGNHYGDWLQINAETPRPVLASAYLAHALDLVARAAAVVAPEREAYYSDLFAQAKAAFAAAYLHEDATIEGDTQTVYLLALAFNLVSEEARPLLADHLVRAVEANDRLLSTGFVGVSLLCPVLSSIGRDDLAFALLETDRYPSWLYSVRHGATTIWERWDGWTEHAGFQSVKMNSFNHYSLGSVGEWLYGFLAGIDQTRGSVAYETLSYSPRIGGGITEVDASFTSPRGEILSSWRRNGDTAEFDLTLPPGVTAEAVLPGTRFEVDGTTVPEGRFTLGSGRHQMRVSGLDA